jgi:flagellar basal-body rod modification protein FlgD
MDTNEFTRELVQFSSVEQQIKTNTSLTRLIELTQAGEVMQSSAMIGRQVTIENDQMPLQSGRGTVRFSLPADQPVVVSILNDKGEALAEASVAGRRGGNDWSWDGKAANGKTQPDGAYRVAVHALGADGTPRAVAFQVVGTASGVVSDGTGVRLQLGEVSVPFSRVRAVGG